MTHAFGVREKSLRRLAGGQGLAWTDGRLVLKPVGCLPEHDWVCEVYAGWSADDVRVPEPVRAADNGGWSVAGWGAHVFLEGSQARIPHEIEQVKSASDGFHHQLRALPRPGFLDARDDPWSYGDRLAWEDAAPWGDEVTLALVQRLRRQLAPVSQPAQVIHGDILPNVLLAEDQPPAVIDWPPYFRPREMANAITVTDAVTFHGASLSLLEDWAAGPDWDQLLLRALLYRLGPTMIFARHDRLMGNLVTHVQRVRPVVDAVLARLER